MKGCKIIQDLLPNYIEGLTNEETNSFIEKHLNECENCKKLLNNMKKDIEIDTKIQYQKETKYLKKYNKKITILKCIIILFIMIYTIFIGRKMLILGNIQNNIEKYIEISNYHIKSYYYKNVFNNRQPSIEEQEASSLKTLMSWLRRGKLPV